MWSADFAYAVGLMTTDGCLSPDRRHLTFVSKDLDQVENVKRILDLSVKIGISYGAPKGKGKPYYRVQWGDVALYNFFLSIGLTSNKSLTLEKLTVPDEYFFDFLRGHHDGDGCFYSYYDSRWRSSYMFYLAFTSASVEHLRWIRETLERLIGVTGSLSTHKQKGRPNSFHQLKCAKRETLLVLDQLYKNPDYNSLSRKRLKIEKALSIVGKSLPCFDK